jgi:exodeoxyribonuclease-3
MAYRSRSRCCVCREIKAMEDQIDTEAFKEAGYEYQYYYSAQKRLLRNYIISKISPIM